MRVNLGTVELSDDQRKAWRRRFGASGMATREDVAREAQRAVFAVLAEADSLPAPKRAAVVTKPKAVQGDELKCRHCGHSRHWSRHRMSGVDGGHKFEPLPWPDEKAGQ